VAKIWRFATFLPQFGEIKVNMRPIFPVAPFRCLFVGRISMTITEFLRAEDGVATIDWIVLTAALTGLGLWLMTNLGGGTLNTHTQNIRGELQDPHFDTDWFDYVAVLPPSME
jgi:hypothetical protein